MTGILFLDLDGTVRESVDDPLGRFVNGPEDVRVFPEAVTMMRRWVDDGGICVGITNQGGIALGHVTAEQVHAALRETAKQCDDLLSTVVYCDHYPSVRACWCRKPSPGMIYRAVTRVGDVYGREHVPEDCLMVGDMESDRLCAERAGVPFEEAKDWRARA